MYFPDDFFNSNFWIYWKTMFAFEPWHSAMEMRRYLIESSSCSSYRRLFSFKIH
ncbi:oleate hydratase [Staphylococcus aureus]